MKKRSARSAKNAEAYRRSMILLKDKSEGFVPYKKLFTSIDEVTNTFPDKLTDFLSVVGYKFFWQRLKDQPLALYGKNYFLPSLKAKGLVEICRFRLPEEWIGIGRVKIHYIDVPSDTTPLLISLYLYSVNPADLTKLVRTETSTAAYLASIYLDGNDLETFYALAEERFDSLK